MPDACREIPYNGGKEMLQVDNVENRMFLRELFETMAEELLDTGRKKK